MTPTAAKALLKKESELLAKLIDTVTQFPLGAEGATVLNDWTEYFRRWQTVNDEIRQLDDNEFRQRIKGERKVLKDMRDAINDNTSTGTFYRDMLASDIGRADQIGT